MTVFVDPAPGLYPYCVCKNDCELPCWQRDGFDPTFDASKADSCCCSLSTSRLSAADPPARETHDPSGRRDAESESYGKHLRTKNRVKFTHQRSPDW